MSLIDHTAIGRPQVYDDRFAYNPPRLDAPAISQEQFDYDNQRDIEAALLANPVVMAHTIMMVKDRLSRLEDKINARSS